MEERRGEEALLHLTTSKCHQVIDDLIPQAITFIAEEYMEQPLEHYNGIHEPSRKRRRGKKVTRIVDRCVVQKVAFRNNG